MANSFTAPELLATPSEEADEMVPGRRYPSPEALARFDAWMATEDPEWLALFDKLDRRVD